MDENAVHEMTATSGNSGLNEKLNRQLKDIEKACVILAENETEDPELTEILETMGLSVKFCDESQIELQRNDIRSIIVQDFSSFVDERDPAFLFYGPACIKREAALTPSGQRPQLPFSGHSMLSTMLMNRKCCLSLQKKSNMRVRAQIYALGGRLSKRVHEADLLVSSCASGDQYKLAQNFRIPVVTPAFIDALWQKRDSLDFRVTEDLIDAHRLDVFAKLKMFFYGFESARKEELNRRAGANGAAVVSQLLRSGTYIVVVNRDACSTDEILKLDRDVSPESLIVYEEWFHESIKEGYALCEKQDKFNARRAALLASSPMGKRKRLADNSPSMTPKSKKSMESLLLSPRVEELSRLESCSGVLSPSTGAASPIRTEQITDRRHLILLELRDTEKNYLAVLEFIDRMSETKLTVPLAEKDGKKKEFPNTGPQSTDASDRDSTKEKTETREIITRFEKQEIFKEIPNIISLHKVLLQRIEDALNSMDFKNIAAIFNGEDACGKITPDSSGGSEKVTRKKSFRNKEENNIVAAYSTYLNGMETIVERVKTLTAENPEFAEFVRYVESQPECKREKFIDLLIRPVQRWPSIVNILTSYSNESEKLAKKLEERCNGSKEDQQLRKEAAQVRLGAQDALRVSRFIQTSLMKMNESKHQTAQICEALKTQSLIEDIPAMYWSKQYTLSHQCEATLTGVSESYPQAAGQKSLKNVEVVCFLFSHGLEIARKKIGKQHKPYKHVAFIHFDKMNAIIDSLDSSLKRYIEIVFREQRKNYANSESDADSVSLGAGSDLVASEFTEERVLLDLKDVNSKDGLLNQMEKEYKAFSRIERISVSDHKEGVRTDSLLLNLPSGAHGNTPVTQFARSLSSVPELSTPKKLTRSISNIIKKGLQGIGTTTRQRDEPPPSSSPSSSSMGPLSRSRNTALPRCMSSSSCASSSSGPSSKSKYRFLSSLSPLSRRMDLLVLDTLSSMMPSATTSASSSYNFEPEKNRRYPNRNNINNNNNNNHHTESHMKTHASKVSVDPSTASPVKLRAISTTMREAPTDVVMNPEPPLPTNNRNSNSNSNRTKNTINNNSSHKNHSKVKEKKKSKRKSSNF